MVPQSCTPIHLPQAAKQLFWLSISQFVLQQIELYAKQIAKDISILLSVPIFTQKYVQANKISSKVKKSLQPLLKPRSWAELVRLATYQIKAEQRYTDPDIQESSVAQQTTFLPQKLKVMGKKEEIAKMKGVFLRT